MTDVQAANIVKQFTLRVPGSTSNLGPGFDTVGLALNIYAKITFLYLENNDLSIPFVTMRGGIADKSLDSDQGALVYNLLSELWKHDQSMLQRVRVIIESDIPLGYGLGSSSSAVLSAVWASYYFKDLIPTTNDLVREGAVFEGHPENLAASLMGNMVVCAKTADGRGILAERIKWPQKWKVLMVVPQYSLTTKAARHVLPKRVDFDIAVSNMQKTALLVAAVTNINEKAMREVFADKLHEPYRENMVPELPAIRRLLAYEPVIGCFLSGAGSSVGVIVHHEMKDKIKSIVQSWCDSQPLPPSILDLSVDTEGAQIAGPD